MFFGVKQIAAADAKIEDMARLHTVRIVIVVFGAGLRQNKQARCHQFSGAIIRTQTMAKRGDEVAARQAN